MDQHLDMFRSKTLEPLLTRRMRLLLLSCLLISIDPTMGRVLSTDDWGLLAATGANALSDTILPCVEAGLCRGRAFGTLAEDVSKFGNVPPCRFHGWVRCIELGAPFGDPSHKQYYQYHQTSRPEAPNYRSNSAGKDKLLQEYVHYQPKVQVPYQKPIESPRFVPAAKHVAESTRSAQFHQTDKNFNRISQTVRQNFQPPRAPQMEQRPVHQQPAENSRENRITQRFDERSRFTQPTQRFEEASSQTFTGPQRFTQTGMQSGQHRVESRDFFQSTVDNNLVAFPQTNQLAQQPTQFQNFPQPVQQFAETHRFTVEPNRPLLPPTTPNPIKPPRPSPAPVDRQQIAQLIRQNSQPPIKLIEAGQQTTVRVEPQRFSQVSQMEPQQRQEQFPQQSVEPQRMPQGTQRPFEPQQRPIQPPQQFMEPQRFPQVNQRPVEPQQRPTQPMERQRLPQETQRPVEAQQQFTEPQRLQQVTQRPAESQPRLIQQSMEPQRFIPITQRPAEPQQRQQEPVQSKPEPQRLAQTIQQPSPQPVEPRRLEQPAQQPIQNPQFVEPAKNSLENLFQLDPTGDSRLAQEQLATLIQLLALSASQSDGGSTGTFPSSPGTGSSSSQSNVLPFITSSEPLPLESNNLF